MGSDADERARLMDALEALRRDVAAMGDRVAAIEQTLATDAAAAGPLSGAAISTGAKPPADEVTPEIVAVISAAIAAYLGVKAHIRQISVLGGASWAQQGRVTIQASHALAIQRD